MKKNTSPALPPARPDGRKGDQLRPVTFTPDIAPAAQGSVLIRMGRTEVICAASITEEIPAWMRAQKRSGGWLTAEYSLLPYSTAPRAPRDRGGKPDGRAQEIQRLIGRALRAVTDLEKLGPRTVWVDCDVLAADGGTRTAAITGAFVALRRAVDRLLREKRLAEDPIREPLAAVSVGIVAGRPLLDLCYAEDSAAGTDMNIVMTAGGKFVEVQGSAEGAPYSGAELSRLLDLARKGIRSLLALQKRAAAAGGSSRRAAAAKS